MKSRLSALLDGCPECASDCALIDSDNNERSSADNIVTRLSFKKKHTEIWSATVGHAKYLHVFSTIGKLRMECWQATMQLLRSVFDAALSDESTQLLAELAQTIAFFVRLEARVIYIGDNRQLKPFVRRLFSVVTAMRAAACASLPRLLETQRRQTVDSGTLVSEAFYQGAILNFVSDSMAERRLRVVGNSYGSYFISWPDYHSDGIDDSASRVPAIPEACLVRRLVYAVQQTFPDANYNVFCAYKALKMQLLEMGLRRTA